MSETQSDTVPTPVVQPSTDETYGLCRLGVELEYPVAPSVDASPAASARRSEDLYEQYGGASSWEEGGRFQHEHTGVEISSPILDIHSEEPEEWFEATVAACESYGHPFAATGWGDTNFGMHQHISNLTSDEADKIRSACSNEWARVFWCTSVNHNSVDPWRHGGVGSPGEPFSTFDPRGAGSGPTESSGYHWEFRLPEPALPEHFSLMANFWRITARDSIEAAIDYARERVHERDARLTAVQQYQQLREERDDWPDEDAFSERCDRSVGEWFVDLME